MTVRHNGRSTILLLDSKRSAVLEMEYGKIPNGTGVAIKVHRSPKEFERECAYYIRRGKNPPGEIRFYEIATISSLLPSTKFRNKRYRGIVLERIDLQWLKSTRGARLLQLGPGKNDVAVLSIAQKIKARILLWQSASKLPPEHDQINILDIVIILEANMDVRASIIDFGDQSEPDANNFTEVFRVLQDIGLEEPERLIGFLGQIIYFLGIEILYRMISSPLQALENFSILLTYLWLHPKIWATMPNNYRQGVHLLQDHSIEVLD